KARESMRSKPENPVAVIPYCPSSTTNAVRMPKQLTTKDACLKNLSNSKLLKRVNRNPIASASSTFSSGIEFKISSMRVEIVVTNSSISLTEYKRRNQIQ